MTDQQEPVPEVVCSGGLQLPKLSAFVPLSGDQLAELLRKAQADE